ncbi:aminotransferase class V-fold PLP-dependent enzyme [Blastococcus saxobsidens]|uniref:Putative cysteine desulfurase/selenocysteine lyase n=1 Tax=Blastococcus saxobsidens (strain DD2) TaxID=1146883 RepID=H6RMF0_BLASD|nr:aminotransferase class V-fold PLP-dependent enzyme [Blastococcus saxobsidens]CCG02586.1 putative cysteine desulfurase/selenocysteine lyase [Blastococcus saxobsidens DD2]
MTSPDSEPPPLTWEQVRTLYPGTADVSYLDAAAVGLISSRVREAMTGVLVAHERGGIAAAPGWRVHAESVRASVARLVDGRAEQISFTQNTSTGLATVTNGVDWRDGDNVVVPAGEFPSNFYPWLQLRRRGVEVREVPMTGGLAAVDDVLTALDDRTRVLAISAVQYSSGHRYDLAAFGDACQSSDVLLVVDGTQAVGAVTVDVERLGIDVLAVSAHKWMLGPFGIGFIHLSRRAMQRLNPSTVGWLSVEDPFAFDHEPRLAEDARRFESGTENSAGIAGLGATVDLVHELGRQRVENRILERAEHLAALLEEAGMDVHLPQERDRRSGIVIASSPTDAPHVLHERLLSRGVRCSQRGNGLRFSPHYFTDDSDLHRAAHTLRHGS